MVNYHKVPLEEQTRSFQPGCEQAHHLIQQRQHDNMKRKQTARDTAVATATLSARNTWKQPEQEREREQREGWRNAWKPTPKSGRRT